MNSKLRAGFTMALAAVSAAASSARVPALEAESPVVPWDAAPWPMAGVIVFQIELPRIGVQRINGNLSCRH